MSEPEFNLMFLDQATDAVDLDDYRHFFLEYRPEKWAADSNGGLLQYFDANDNEYSLTIHHSPEHGVGLSYGVDVDGVMSTHVTVGDPSRMNEIVDVGVDEFVPVGAFLAPKDAWPIVEAFLTNPTERPSAKQLRNIREANWPEIYS